jgi:alcohol dehydrogenase (cytochrome c)
MEIFNFIRLFLHKAAMPLVLGSSAVLLMAQDQPRAEVSAPLNVPGESLRSGPPSANWLSYNGDYSGRRFSALDEIKPDNVKQLHAQWVFHPGNSNSLEVTPVVVDGVMFVTSANDAFALDARTGREIWHHSRPVTRGLVDDAAGHHNRGVAVWHDRVFMETDNAHLLCLDARSGHQIWDIEFADSNRNYGSTSAPLVVNDKVIVGPSGGDDAVRGFIAAFDPLNGKLIWRFWTIPGPGEFGNSSWPGKMYLHGGGTAWMPGTFDPELNTLFWGTSNPSPDFDGAPRPGDDLYTDCLLALDPDTGRLKWYFQFTPHDLFDYDATETAVLIDCDFRGENRKLLVEANRNGFLYVLDRATGKFLLATPFVDKLNWAKGIDSAGRPITSGVFPTAAGTKICPGMTGATNWFSPSYNPFTHLFYFMALENCEIFQSKPEPMAEGRTWYATGTRRIPGEEGKKILLGFSLESASVAWRYPQVGDGDSWGGTMTTAGGLVFFGDDAGSFEAVEAHTGAPLWHFNTGQKLHASPMSYAVGGSQYVAIASGSDIFSFALKY